MKTPAGEGLDSGGHCAGKSWEIYSTYFFKVTLSRWTRCDVVRLWPAVLNLKDLNWFKLLEIVIRPEMINPNRDGSITDCGLKTQTLHDGYNFSQLFRYFTCSILVSLYGGWLDERQRAELETAKSNVSIPFFIHSELQFHHLIFNS